MKNKLQKFLIAQKTKIEEDKYYEGIKIETDPGQTYVINWILQRGAWFRMAWEKSLCNSCSSSTICGYKTKQICENFNNFTSEGEE